MSDWVCLTLKHELQTVIFSLWEMINGDIIANFLIPILIDQLYTFPTPFSVLSPNWKSHIVVWPEHNYQLLRKNCFLGKLVGN